MRQLGKRGGCCIGDRAPMYDLHLETNPYSNPYLRPHQFPYLHNEEVGQRSSKTPSSQAFFGSKFKNWDEWWVAGEAPRGSPPTRPRIWR